MAYTTLGIISVIKSIQRGVYAGAGGTVAITSVDVSKSIVFSVSKGSAGYVAARGGVTGDITPSQNAYSGISYPGAGMGGIGAPGQWNSYSASLSISGGTTSLTTKAYSAILTDAVTITCDGPCEWQVVEYI